MSDSDETDDECSEEDISTPSHLTQIPNEANKILLPQQSKKMYEKRYQDFMEWKTTKNKNSISEDVLVTYFEELATKYKASTLWSIYSMLRSTLGINHQIDLSKYAKLVAFIKLKSKGYEGKKAKTFVPEEINTFLNEAPDKQYLFTKVALIFGIMGACRRQELHKLRFSDVQVMKSSIVVKIANRKTRIDRCFTITGKYYYLCKQYILLRPKNCSQPFFFLNYISGQCTSLNVGINKLGNIGKTIAGYLKLPNPELYTGNCFRRTSATILVNAGGDLTLKEQGGWKSTSHSVEVDIDDSIRFDSEENANN